MMNANVIFCRLENAVLRGSVCKKMEGGPLPYVSILEFFFINGSCGDAGRDFARMEPDIGLYCYFFPFNGDFGLFFRFFLF
jgi:hypothetical protein